MVHTKSCLDIASVIRNTSAVKQQHIYIVLSQSKVFGIQSKNFTYLDTFGNIIPKLIAITTPEH
jgi:hypothetical protein